VRLCSGVEWEGGRFWAIVFVLSSFRISTNRASAFESTFSDFRIGAVKTCLNPGRY